MIQRKLYTRPSSFNLIQGLRIRNKRADTFSCQLSLATANNWSSWNCCMPSRSWDHASPAVFLICAFAMSCSKQFPFSNSLPLPPDSIQLLETQKQLSCYLNWTWTLNLRRFTHRWASGLPGLPASAMCEVSPVCPWGAPCFIFQSSMVLSSMA